MKNLDNDNSAKEANAPPIDAEEKIVIEKRGFGVGALLFMLIVGIILGCILTHRYQNVIDRKLGKKAVVVVHDQDKPQPAYKSTKKAEIIAALRTIRRYVAPITEKIDAMETERDRELRMRNHSIYQEGKSPDSEDCKRLEKRAKSWQRDIDTEQSKIKDFLAAEKELKLALDTMVTEGYASTRDPKAYQALEHARELAIKAGIEQEWKRQLEQGSAIPDDEWNEENGREGKVELILE